MTGWLYALAVNVALLFSLSGAASPGFALELSERMENGRTFGELSTLLGEGEAIRLQAADPDLRSATYNKIFNSLSLGDVNKNAEEIFSYNLSHSIVIPVFDDISNYLIFYNNVTDIAIITRWGLQSGVFAFYDARIILAERLRAAEPKSQGPHWLLVEDIPSVIQNYTSYIQHKAAASSPDFTTIIEGWFSSSNDKINVEATLVSRRTALTALGTTNQIVTCGDKLHNTIRYTSSIKQLSIPSNIKTFDYQYREISAIGGTQRGVYSMLLYSLRDDPSYLILVAADKEHACAPVRAFAFSALSGMEANNFEPTPDLDPPVPAPRPVR